MQLGWFDSGVQGRHCPFCEYVPGGHRLHSGSFEFGGHGSQFGGVPYVPAGQVWHSVLSENGGHGAQSGGMPVHPGGQLHSGLGSFSLHLKHLMFISPDGMFAGPGPPAGPPTPGGVPPVNSGTPGIKLLNIWKIGKSEHSMHSSLHSMLHQPSYWNRVVPCAPGMFAPVIVMLGSPMFSEHAFVSDGPTVVPAVCVKQPASPM